MVGGGGGFQIRDKLVLRYIRIHSYVFPSYFVKKKKTLYVLVGYLGASGWRCQL